MNNAVNHRNMRVLLILIISVFSLMFYFGRLQTKEAFADPSYTPKVTIQSKTVHRGQTFSVDVDMRDNEGLTSLKLTLDYDETAMTLRDVVQGEALSSMTLTTTNVETELGYSIRPFNILWDSRTVDNTNGTILTLIFDSNIEAPVGEYTISMTYDVQNTNMAYLTPIDIEITDGIINLITGEFKAIYQDYNGSPLYEKDYNADDIPGYPTDYPTPSRQEDDEYTYMFNDWRGVLSDDLNTIIYEADYLKIPKVYTLFLYIDGITNEPDAMIDESDFYVAIDYAFGSYIELPEAPFKQYYQFFGWYIDSDFTKTLNFAKMPAHNTRLYARYSYEVRENNIPLIILETEELDTDSVVVTASLVRNTGINGMVLTLDYDLSVLRLRDFNADGVLSSMIFDYTNIEKINEPNFKFIYEHSENNYDTGVFLTLYFDIIDRSQTGIYNVTFTYDYHTDATYKNIDGEIKYTKLEIVGAEVPIGEINHWFVELSDERSIDVTSRDGKPVNVTLSVELVTEKINIEKETVKEVVGKKFYLQSGYAIKLMQNGVEIEPNTNLTIKIKLTANERKCKKLKFYYYNDDKELEEHEFKVENNELIFETDHLSDWLIFGDYNKNKGFESDSKVVVLIMYPILLAITTMSYAFIQKGKITKLKNAKNLNKEAHNE